MPIKPGMVLFALAGKCQWSIVPRQKQSKMGSKHSRAKRGPEKHLVNCWPHWQHNGVNKKFWQYFRLR
jgi:hypothetical protein